MKRRHPMRILVDRRGACWDREGEVLERVFWDCLTEVWIATTDRGPFVEDLFFVLGAGEEGVVVDHETVRELGLLELLQSLPGFDNQQVMRACASTGNARFPVWTGEPGDASHLGGRVCQVLDAPDLRDDPGWGAWRRAWIELDLQPLRARQSFAALVDRYAEPARRYHTMEHVLRCLWVGKQARLPAKDEALVTLALFYHDAVYDPRSWRNEARSAALADQALYHAGLDAPTRQRLCGWILASARHPAVVSDPLGQLVLDIDLSILAAPPKDFRRYENEVRAEHHHIPSPIYRWCRRRLYRRWLRAGALFHTKLGRDWETQAHHNLRASLARGADPGAPATP